MAAAAILDWQNFKFLTIGTVKRFEVHHRAKLRQKSVELQPRYCDFSIFQDGGRRHLGFLKFETFNGSERSKGLNCTIVSNFVEIAQNAAEI